MTTHIQTLESNTPSSKIKNKFLPLSKQRNKKNITTNISLLKVNSDQKENEIETDNNQVHVFDNQLMKDYEGIINDIYIKLSDLSDKSVVESNIKYQFKTGIDENLSIKKKLESIDIYIRLLVEEKLKFYSNSKLEVKNIDDVLMDLKINNSFSQSNFTRLIERVKVGIQSEKQDYAYIEVLKNRIIVLEREKEELIKVSKSTIDTLKQDSLDLIRKIESLSNEKEVVERNLNEILMKVDLVEKKDVENRLLRKEIDSMKCHFEKEKTRLNMVKEKRVKEIEGKIKYMLKLEKENLKKEEENCKLKNNLIEKQKDISKVEIKKKIISSQVSNLENKLCSTMNNLNKARSLYINSRKTITYLINSEPFQKVKRQMKVEDEEI